RRHRRGAVVAPRASQAIAEAGWSVVGDSSERSKGNFGAVGDGRRQGGRTRRCQGGQFLFHAHGREIRDSREEPAALTRAIVESLNPPGVSRRGLRAHPWNLVSPKSRRSAAGAKADEGGRRERGMSDFAAAFPNSRKIHVDGPYGVRVPMREIALTGG